MAEYKFPTEMVDLPSKGYFYFEGHPLSSGKVEVKYMTAKEEDILTSQNLIKKGVVVDRLLNSLIMNKDVSVNDLLIGDKNAVMIAARILAYGSNYEVEVQHPTSGVKVKHAFDLTDCPFKELPTDIDYSTNEFELELPVSKTHITIKLLTGNEESAITKEVKSLQKVGQTAEVTTRLRYLIQSVDGETDKQYINSFVDNMLSKDSLYLRDYVMRINPDIDLTQEIDIEGEAVEVTIPMTVEFFWPKTTG